MTLRPKYRCHYCLELHETEWEAEECCGPPEVVEVWECPDCGETYETESCAIDCCGYDPEGQPPTAEELEAAGQERLF